MNVSIEYMVHPDPKRLYDVDRHYTLDVTRCAEVSFSGPVDEPQVVITKYFWGIEYMPQQMFSCWDDEDLDAEIDAAARDQFLGEYQTDYPAACAEMKQVFADKDGKI